MSQIQEPLTIIVPVYNEAQVLPRVAPGIIEYCTSQLWQVIFVDDGSRDGSGEYLDSFAKSSKTRVFHHKVNRGYGGAIKTGILNANTPYCVTFDADGQHNLQDVEMIFGYAMKSHADLVVGNRGIQGESNVYRAIGKRMIRLFTRLLMPLPIKDLNSGLKLYRTDLAKKYLKVCPNSMSFSDVITLVFVNQNNLVLEYPITVVPRKTGKSTISTYTAFETLLEILNIILMFNPLRVFLPISFFCICLGLIWGITVLFLVGRGVSVGAMLAIVTGLIFFVLGLLANQISAMRMESLHD
jgi:glycosyltransferase involved in cell wall biosynthesis